MGQKSRKKTKRKKSKTVTSPNNFQHEVIIVGAGLAGLFAALKLAPLPTTLIAAKTLGKGTSSHWAQGGIAAAIGEGDTPEAHAQDTIDVGAGLVDENIAHFVTKEANERISDLLEFGVPFDKDLKGKLQLSREAAHSKRRIVRVDGDRAGSAIMTALIETVRNTPSINIIEQAEVHKLSKNGRAINGVYIWPSTAKGTGEGALLESKNVILATGGCGHLFSKTTNPNMARGEGIAMAARIGAVISDPEFIQFHPTAIDTNLTPAPLATEALRGEGAHLINSKNERFMLNIHESAELAPRDIVARAVDRELKSGRGAYLDCATTIGKKMKDHFPTVIKKCKEAGINPIKEPIPVAPAAHFHMGGIVTDANGRTTIDGLWACGEVASTGLHGGNRLASNSLLEAVVFANRIAEDIHNQAGSQPQKSSNFSIDEKQAISPKLDKKLKKSINELRDMMFMHVGVERDQKGLEKAKQRLKDLTPKFEQSEKTKNMCLTAKFIITGALNRLESRGSHYRTDKTTKCEPAKRTFLTLINVEDEFNKD
ncbi:MAG: L-aspartate oxidase [Rhizobiales bacterium]|nr:L-aspartate oxidase [Hyphomicrobiales bacterium]